MFDMEQGVMTDCIYCRDVYPQLHGDCPVCRNAGSSFTPARMMDRNTSLGEVFNEILHLAEVEENIRKEPDQSAGKEYRRQLLCVLRNMMIHDFDLTEAVVLRIHQLDEEFDIAPESGEY